MFPVSLAILHSINLAKRTKALAPSAAAPITSASAADFARSSTTSHVWILQHEMCSHRGTSVSFLELLFCGLFETKEGTKGMAWPTLAPEDDASENMSFPTSLEEAPPTADTLRRTKTSHPRHIQVAHVHPFPLHSTSMLVSRSDSQ